MDYKFNLKNIILFIKVNVLSSFLFWIISRINIYSLNHLSNQNYSIVIYNSLLYAIILIVILYVLKNSNKLFLTYSLAITSISVIIGVTFTLNSPICATNDYIISNRYYFYVAILFILFSIIFSVYIRKKNIIDVIYIMLLGVFHLTITTYTYYLNYIVLYEKIINMLF